MAQHNGTLAFLVCVGGIYASYLTYGYVQEAMFRTQPDGTKFSGTWLLLAIQCAANALVGYAAHLILTATGAVAPPPKTAAPFMSWTSQSTLFTISFTYLAAMTASTEAISFVSYPTMALVKSCKMIPVMLARVLYLGKHYHWLKYVCVVAMAAGIAIFQLSRIKPRAVDDDGADLFNTLIGYGLLFASLSFDALTGPRQEELQAKVQTSSVLFMAMQNVWAVLIAGLAAVTLGQAVPGLQYLVDHPDLWVATALFAVSSAVGQLFIFYTVMNFDSLVLTTVTTTRKFFTLLVSVLAHGHPMSTTQWSAVFVVFGAIIADKFGPGWLGLKQVNKHHTAADAGTETPHAEETLDASEHLGAVDLHHEAETHTKQA